MYNGWGNRSEFGYHSFHIYNFHVQGQRNPVKRLEKIKEFYSFPGKKVMDLGCNTGGMLFHVSEIAKGVGVDYDQKCIDSCNFFKERLCLGCHLEFYKDDLNTMNYKEFCERIKFQPDIVFMLSIGSWVKNWNQLYSDVYASGAAILLETNNDTEGAPQLQLFRDFKASIQLVSDKSDDDCTGNFLRKTYLIQKPIESNY
jgi:SAM-dependent methyltransferase